MIDVFLRDNLIYSFKEIACRLRTFLFEVLHQITGENDAFYQRILDEDITNYNEKCGYHKFMRLTEQGLPALFGVQVGQEICQDSRNAHFSIREILGKMDLAGAVKAINQTVCAGPIYCNRVERFGDRKERIRGFTNNFLVFRGMDGHDYEDLPEDEALHALEDICNSLADRELRSDFRTLYRNCANGELVPLFDELQAELSALTADIHLYLEGYTIDQSSTELLDAKHLCSYQLVADEWALMSRYNQFLLRDVLKYCRLNVFDATWKLLMDIHTNDPTETKCKDVLSVFEKELSDGSPHLTIRKDFARDDGVSCDTEDSILALLEKAPERRIGVILGEESASLSKKLLAESNPNHVALRLRSKYGVECLSRMPQFNVQLFDACPVSGEMEDGKEAADNAPREGPELSLRFSAEEPAQSTTAEEMPVLTSAAERPISVSAKEASVSPSELAEKPRPVRTEEDWTPTIYIPGEGDSIYLDPHSDRQRTVLEKRIGGGAEGTIYTCRDFGRRVVKIFGESQLTDERIEKLNQMYRFYRSAPDKAAFRGICWPTDMVYAFGGHLVGYMMERVPNGYTLEDILTALQVQQVPGKEVPVQKRSDLVEICEHIAEGFDRLHALDETLLMGDVNPKNLMVDNDKNVWFVDVDSYQFRDFRCQVGRPEFFSLRLSRETKNGRSLREIPREAGDEKAALSTLIFYTLFLRQLPYDATGGVNYTESIEKRLFVYGDPYAPQTRHSYIWQNLSPQIQNMFYQAFGGGKGVAMRYPEAKEWRDGLHEMLGQILDRKRLSDEIYPTASLLGEDDLFLRIPCRNCSRVFEVSKQEQERNRALERSGETELCPDCKNARSYFQSVIRARICESCGNPFTVNAWDDSKRTHCPDCDRLFNYSRRSEFSNEAEFEQKLREKLAAAVNNYRASEE